MSEYGKHDANTFNRALQHALNTLEEEDRIQF